MSAEDVISELTGCTIIPASNSYNIKVRIAPTQTHTEAASTSLHACTRTFVHSCVTAQQSVLSRCRAWQPWPVSVTLRVKDSYSLRPDGITKRL
ncbi:hypothetical protein EXN66_Car012683 [Channa argus]|uniref:Uncharacterized protein n=1 Tax=Channa argus TaxID=215402 RepID=A0A6G1Q3R7_CHAAH|nr:hypothetical protein EXN66_Car012683 [Channa argus]